MSKKLVALMMGALLLVTVAVAIPADTQAANLSGGSYTYVINGEEVAFPYDPIVQKDGALLPLEVFTHLGVAVTGALERTPTLSYGPVSAQLTLGRQVATVGGKVQELGVAPVRLNGRLFAPAQLLDAFGISFSQEGNFVTISRYPMPGLTRRESTEWRALKQVRGFATSVKADSTFLEAEFHLLNQEMLSDQNLAIDFGTRTRLLGLLETNTLVLVSLSNTSFKSGALQPTGIYLVDQRRNQYEVSSVIDIGQGLLSTKLAPDASRMGVLLLPRLAEGGGAVKLYYEASGVVLGTFSTAP